MIKFIRNKEKLNWKLMQQIAADTIKNKYIIKYV